VTGLALKPVVPNFFAWDVRLLPPAQIISGFGAAFSQLGWQALLSLSQRAREEALSAPFGNDGAALTLCRTPLGANDFSRGWYSYDETAARYNCLLKPIWIKRPPVEPFAKPGSWLYSGGS